MPNAATSNSKSKVICMTQLLKNSRMKKFLFYVWNENKILWLFTQSHTFKIVPSPLKNCIPKSVTERKFNYLQNNPSLMFHNSFTVPLDFWLQPRTYGSMIWRLASSRLRSLARWQKVCSFLLPLIHLPIWLHASSEEASFRTKNCFRTQTKREIITSDKLVWAASVFLKKQFIYPSLSER